MQTAPFDWLCPDWPAPPTVRAWTTTRTGGVSTGAFATMNLGLHSGDETACVQQNRAILAAHMAGARIAWLEQVLPRYEAVKNGDIGHRQGNEEGSRRRADGRKPVFGLRPARLRHKIKAQRQ